MPLTASSPVPAVNGAADMHDPPQAAVTPWVNITGKGLYTLLVVDPDAAKGNVSAPVGEWYVRQHDVAAFEQGPHLL